MGFVARKAVVSPEDVASWPHVVGCLSGSYPSTGFAQSTMVFIPQTDTVHEQVRIVRSPNAPRQVTLCNCDCKALTTATCFRLRQFSLKCTHPSQGCVTQHHATYNVFQSERALCVQDKEEEWHLTTRLCLQGFAASGAPSLAAHLPFMHQ